MHGSSKDLHWQVFARSRRFDVNKIPVGAAPLCLPSTNRGNHGGIAPTIIGPFFHGNPLGMPRNYFTPNFSAILVREALFPSNNVWFLATKLPERLGGAARVTPILLAIATTI